MRRDTGLAGAEDCVHPIETLDRRTTATGFALVARRRGVIEIIAARPLQQVAAGRGHVAQLLRGARQDRAGQQRIALLNQRVTGEIAVRHQRADPQAAPRRFLDGLERQPRDVDQPRRTFDVLLHQIDQVGAASDEFCCRIGRDLPHRVGDVVGPRVLKIDHGLPPIAIIAC